MVVSESQWLSRYILCERWFAEFSRPGSIIIGLKSSASAFLRSAVNSDLIVRDVIGLIWIPVVENTLFSGYNLCILSNAATGL